MARTPKEVRRRVKSMRLHMRRSGCCIPPGARLEGGKHVLVLDEAWRITSGGPEVWERIRALGRATAVDRRSQDRRRELRPLVQRPDDFLPVDGEQSQNEAVRLPRP